MIPIRTLAYASGLLLAGALLLMGVGIAFGEQKPVAGTKHDVSVGGVPPCAYCHEQRDPAGDVLWRRTSGPDSDFSPVKALCFSCHDGTVTSVGVYVFDPSRPLHPMSPGVKGQDCDRCHDPHDPGAGKFIKRPGGASFCMDCHPRAGLGHPVDVDAIAAGKVPIDSTWDPAHGDFNGTRLWNSDGTGPGNYVKCLTCHSPHGGQPGSAMNTYTAPAGDHSFSALCFNCHNRDGSTGGVR